MIKPPAVPIHSRPPSQGKTAPTAILSLVFSLVGLCFLPVLLLSIVLGHVARSQCKHNSGLKGKGMALAALCISYVYGTVIVLLIVALLVFFKPWEIDLTASEESEITTEASTDSIIEEKETTIKIENSPEIVADYIQSIKTPAEHPLDRALSDIDDEYSYLDRAPFEEHPEEAAPLLVQLVEDEKQFPKIRADAALILLSIAPDEGKIRFSRLLDHKDINVRKSALYRIDTYPDLAQKHRDWLAPILLDQLKASSLEINAAAIYASATAPAPQIIQTLQHLQVQAKTDPHSELAQNLVDCLCQVAPNNDTVDVLLQQLSVREKLKYHEVKNITGCLHRLPAASKQKVLSYLINAYQKGDERAMQVLCQYGDASYLSLIEAYFADAHAKYRTDAFRAMARIKDQTALSLLLSGLQDKGLTYAALQEIARIYAGSAHPEILKALSELNASGFHNKTQLIACALAVSPDSIPPVAKDIISSQSYPAYQAGPIFWLLKKMTIEQALNDFIAAGLLDDRSYAEDVEEMREEYKDAFPYDLFLFTLEKLGVMAMFDVEVGTYPVDHDALIHLFSDISRGRFKPEYASQSLSKSPNEAEKYVYTINWVLNNKLYSVTAEDYGDWYDLGSLVDGANDALKDNQLTERFILVDTGDQTAQIIFGDQSVIEDLARKYYLPIQWDVSASEDRGKAFETEVKKLLESGKVE